jgi:hypothetical protein
MDQQSSCNERVFFPTTPPELLDSSSAAEFILLGTTSELVIVLRGGSGYFCTIRCLRQQEYEQPSTDAGSRATTATFHSTTFGALL